MPGYCVSTSLVQLPAVCDLPCWQGHDAAVLAPFAQVQQHHSCLRNAGVCCKGHSWVRRVIGAGTLSMISTKCTETRAMGTPWWCVELWISSDTLFSLSCDGVTDCQCISQPTGYGRFERSRLYRITRSDKRFV